MGIDKSDQSLPSLLSDLTRDTVELVRQEIALARAEMSTKISHAQTALTSVAIVVVDKSPSQEFGDRTAQTEYRPAPSPTRRPAPRAAATPSASR